MKSLTIILFILGSLLLPAIVYSQDHHDHDHEHDAHDQYHKKNEIGGAVGMVFDLEEQHPSAGLHLHYVRMFSGKFQHFGIAPGAGILFGEHRHYALHIMAIWRPIGGWWIGAGPGVTYFDGHDEFSASGHIETGYEFHVWKVHLGPVVEYAWAKDDQHLMLGLHLGVPF